MQLRRYLSKYFHTCSSSFYLLKHCNFNEGKNLKSDLWISQKINIGLYILSSNVKLVGFTWHETWKTIYRVLRFSTKNLHVLMKFIIIRPKCFDYHPNCAIELQQHLVVSWTGHLFILWHKYFVFMGNGNVIGNMARKMVENW